MKITINGQEREFAAGTTLEEIINKLDLKGKVMAAAINMQIVKQEKWNETIIQEGDKIELLDFVGGG